MCVPDGISLGGMNIHEQDRRQLEEETTDHVKDLCRDFPGHPVAKSPCSQCRGPRFNPWLGNLDPSCCSAEPDGLDKGSEKWAFALDWRLSGHRNGSMTAYDYISIRMKQS